MMFQNIPLNEIDPNPDQPRDHFAGIEELAESIRDEGLLEPIMVRPHEGRYQIVHGERRYRASKVAGLSEVPAIVREMDDKTMFRLSLVENIQRDALTPMEEAASFARLQEQGYTQKQIGRIIGRGQSYVAHKLRLLKAPEVLTYYLTVGALTENHFRQAMRLKKVFGEELSDDTGHYQEVLEAYERGYIEDGVEPEEARKRAATIVLARIRPYGRVSLVAAPEVVVEGLRRWGEYVSKHTELVPLWERHAFWALSFMVCLGANVHDATQLVDKVRDLCLSALANSTLEINWEKGPQTPYQWAIYHDIKHAGLLRVAKGEDESEASLRLQLAATDRVLVDGSIAHPSEAQGGRVNARLLEEMERFNVPSIVAAEDGYLE